MWLYKLADYDYVIEYKKSTENVNANELSKREEEGSRGVEIRVIIVVEPVW